jgi:hypothetical protein
MFCHFERSREAFYQVILLFSTALELTGYYTTTATMLKTKSLLIQNEFFRSVAFDYRFFAPWDAKGLVPLLCLFLAQ